MDIGDKARSIKDRFEKGQIFNNDEDEIDGQQHQRAQEEDMAVFEQGSYILIEQLHVKLVLIHAFPSHRSW